MTKASRARSSALGYRELAAALNGHVCEAHFLPPRPSAKSCLANKFLWRALRTADPQGNMSWKRTELILALGWLCRDKRNTEHWPRKLLECEQNEWVEENAKRLRAHARYISQKMITSPNTLWLQELWGEGQDDLANSNAEDSSTEEPGAGNTGEEDETLEVKSSASDGNEGNPNKEAEQPVYVYGYDPEKHRAYRQRIPTSGGRAERREWGLLWEKPPNAKPTDGMLAVFGDGTKGTIVGMTVQAYEMKKENLARSRGALWHTVHKDGQHVDICRKKDRALILALRYDHKQVLQVRVDTFQVGSASEAEAEKKCLEFLVRIGKDFAEGVFGRDELESQRNQRLSDMNLVVPSKGGASKRALAEAAQGGPMKRPAAAHPVAVVVGDSPGTPFDDAGGAESGVLAVGCRTVQMWTAPDPLAFLDHMDIGL